MCICVCTCVIVCALRVFVCVHVCTCVSTLCLLARQGRPWPGQYLREVLINIVVLNIIMGIMVKLRGKKPLLVIKGL